MLVIALMTGLLPIAFCQQPTVIQRFPVALATQAVAVNKHYFYVINNSTITQYEKKTGQLKGAYDGTKAGIKHLNSGVVLNGKLYCANSNFPGVPMTSSIEIFDAATLKHIGNHSFGIAVQGSVTWIDQKNGYWWVGFAQYSGEHASSGKDNSWTTVLKFDKKWHQMEAWVFPKNVVHSFGTMSNSGGVWGKDGYLYCTGHDKNEIYVMQIPDKGYTLRYVRTIQAPIHGQGIAVDHSERDKFIMYGINKPQKIVEFEIK